MPLFAPDTSDVRAEARVFEQGSYEIAISGTSPFVRTKRDGDGVSAGVLVFSKMVGKIDSEGNVDDEFAGDDLQPMRHYWHTKGARKMSKQFLIPAHGFENEDEFNAEFPGSEPFMIDGEEDEKETWVYGQGWKDLKGKHVRCTLSKGSFEGREQQDFKTFLPAS